MIQNISEHTHFY